MKYNLNNNYKYIFTIHLLISVIIMNPQNQLIYHQIYFLYLKYNFKIKISPSQYCILEISLIFYFTIFFCFNII